MEKKKLIKSHLQPLELNFNLNRGGVVQPPNMAILLAKPQNVSFVSLWNSFSAFSTMSETVPAHCRFFSVLFVEYFLLNFYEIPIYICLNRWK